MKVVKYDKAQWDLVSEGIHELVFGEYRPSSLNRFDFALCVWDESEPIGYITCRETDSESLYIGFGGVFPNQRKSKKSKDGMFFLLDYLRQDYKRANMLVENSNVFMIKKALNHGFRVVGIANYMGNVYLDLRLEWGS